ncbi:MAG TPA: alpha/beta hydrolase-fold protein [Candidatus Xenobia bacterium]|jgi:enterochelin esterase-like enzyme
MNVYVPGSYNQWNPTDPSVRAEQEERKRYVFHRVLPRGIHRFKFVLDGDWSSSWGASGQQRTVAPSSGALAADGDNIVVNAPDGGSYTFTLDLAKQRWQVEAAPHASGFAEALNGTTPHSRLQVLLKALAAVNGNGFPEAMVRDVEQMLLTGEHRGALPLRAGGRALLACLGQPWEDIQVAASWQEWGRQLINLRHVHNTSLHAAVATVPAGIHQYKVVYNGQWTKDAANPWIAPDRIPVPKFQLGEFNSVLGVDESPLLSGRNLLWYPGFESVHMGNGRDIFIWLPPSYLESGTRRYRTLYVLDGNEFMTRSFLHESVLEMARAGDMEDCILVFVTFHSNNERLAEFSDPILRQHYAHFFVDELVPYIDSQFRTSAKATERGICGVSLGGNFSFYLAWSHSDVFGWAGAQGASWGWNQWDIIRLYQSEPARPIRLYLDSAVGEGENDDSGMASRQTASVLKEQGYPVTHMEAQWQPHDWPSWKLRQPHMLQDFAPVTTRQRRRTSTPA